MKSFRRRHMFSVPFSNPTRFGGSGQQQHHKLISRLRAEREHIREKEQKQRVTVCLK